VLSISLKDKGKDKGGGGLRIDVNKKEGGKRSNSPVLIFLILRKEVGPDQRK